jgi:NAD(P)-dependent dehydrogenase (short-subunit alcohol dehydrogenase family)
VTGGSRGIGREIVTRLAADGYAVVVGFAGRKDLADEAVAAVEGAGGRTVAVRADVGDERAIAAMFDAAETAFGGVDVVAHTAGKMAQSTVADLDLAVLDDVHRTNSGKPELLDAVTDGRDDIHWGPARSPTTQGPAPDRGDQRGLQRLPHRRQRDR